MPGRHPDAYVDMLLDTVYGGEPGEAVQAPGPTSSVASSPPLAITFLTPSGADDRNALNAALAALPATGGKVLMGSGAWQIGSVGNVSYQMLTGQHVIIEGQGKVSIASTVPEPGTEYGALTLIGASDGTSECTLRNFAINHTNSGTGLVDCIVVTYPGWPTAPTNRSVRRFTIEDVVTTGASRAGIRVMYTQNGRLVNVTSTSNRMAGVFLLGDDNAVLIGGDYSSNVSGSLGSDYGVSVDSSATVPYATNLTYIGVKANNNGRKGFDVHHGHDIEMIGCSAKGNGYCGFYAVTEGLDKDVGDVTMIGCTADMTGSSASLAARAYEIGSFGTPNAAQKPGTFRLLGCKARAVDANGRTDGLSVLLHNPTSGPPANKFIVTDCDFTNGGGSAARIIQDDSGAVAPAYIKITDNVMHAVTVTQAIWIQTAPTVLLEIDNNDIQVDAAGGVYAWAILAPTAAIGSIANNKATGAVPSNAAAFTTSASLRTYGNSVNAGTAVGISGQHANVSNLVLAGNLQSGSATFDVITGTIAAGTALFTLTDAGGHVGNPVLTAASNSLGSNGFYHTAAGSTAFTLRAVALAVAVGYKVVWWNP